MTREERECRDKAIKDNMASIENRLRHTFNQGYELGKQETCKTCVYYHPDGYCRHSSMTIAEVEQ